MAKRLSVIAGLKIKSGRLHWVGETGSVCHEGGLMMKR